MTGKAIVTGASGLLGRAVVKEFQASNWEVQGWAFSRVREGLKRVDISNKQEVQQAVSEFKPDVIIHSAAERRVDVFEKEPEKAGKINLEGTQIICEAAVSVKAWVLFISTDYVFDGTDPPYKPEDKPNPLNKYGQSKAEGENITLSVNPGNAVLRVPILYGEIETLSESAVTVLFTKVKDTLNKALMCDQQRRFPTHCDDVAFVIQQLAERRLKDSSIKGIFHWSNDENMTKYDMAVTMADLCGLPSDHIERDTTPSGSANRPQNAQLDCSRVEDLGISRRTKFAEAIANILKPFQNI